MSPSFVRVGMKEWTGIEIQRVRQGLEQASASILGRMLFEFSRLDVSLGLVLVWSSDGSRLELLTRRVADYSFHKKLEYLAELACSRYESNQAALAAHTGWIKQANDVREERNNLVHGRWDADPMNDRVVNVVGLPTGEQVENRYTIPELKAVLERIAQLRDNLYALRDQWPV